MKDCPDSPITPSIFFHNCRPLRTRPAATRSPASVPPRTPNRKTASPLRWFLAAAILIALAVGLFWAFADDLEYRLKEWTACGRYHRFDAEITQASVSHRLPPLSRRPVRKCFHIVARCEPFNPFEGTRKMKLRGKAQLESTFLDAKIVRKQQTFRGLHF